MPPPDMTPAPRDSADHRLAALFPDTAGSARPATWWRRKPLLAAVAVASTAVLVAGVVATSAFGSSGASYQTATAVDHRVDSLYTGVATIEPVSQATVAFPVDGTVASVTVAVGNRVAAGQSLASLDIQALNDTLHAKQQALAQANLNLSKALAGESVSSGPGGGTATQATTRASVTSGGSATGTSDRIVLAAATSSDPELAAAQQAVLDAQKAVDAALTTANNALDAALTVCAAAGVDPAAAPTATATGDELTACATAIKGVLTAQTAVNTAQTQLATASTALTNLLEQRAGVPAPATPPPTGGTNPTTPGGKADSTGAATSPSGAANPSGGATSGASSPSAADLVAYQKAVDAAAAELSVAEQGVAQASIASPIDGTVIAVNLAVGDTVTGGSTTADIVVKGAGGYEATTTVSVDDVTDIAVGQAATVLADGTHQALEGTVTSISVAPDAAASTTSYRVTIGFTQGNADLNNGSTGTASIVTESAKSALAVPTSAIRTRGDVHTVTVLDGETAKQVVVEVGVVGATWTEITRGVDRGEQVVLADRSQALPGSATSSSSNATQNGFNRGPTGFPGGGFQGGGPGKP